MVDTQYGAVGVSIQILNGAEVLGMGVVGLQNFKAEAHGFSCGRMSGVFVFNEYEDNLSGGFNVDVPKVVLEFDGEIGEPIGE